MLTTIIVIVKPQINEGSASLYSRMPERRSLLQMTEDDDLQLYKAHERIRALNRELLMQDDASAQISALRKKIAESKEKAQGIVAMANKRIAYLSGMWKEPSEKEPFKSSVSDINSPMRTARTAASKAMEGNEYDAVFSRAVKALDAISTSTMLFGESKKESSRLANELRAFLANLQKSEKLDAQSLAAKSQPVSQAASAGTIVAGTSAASATATSTSKASEAAATPMVLPRKTTPSRSDVDTPKSETAPSTRNLLEQLRGVQKKPETPETVSATKKFPELKTAVSSPTKRSPGLPKKAPEALKNDAKAQPSTGKASDAKSQPSNSKTSSSSQP